MHVIKHICLIFATFLTFSSTKAQEISEDISATPDDLIQAGQLNDRVGPRMDWAPPSRFFMLSYVNQGKFTVKSESQIDGSKNTVDVNSYEEIFGKLKFPILLRENTRIIGGLQYRYHEYNLDEPGAQDDALFTSLDNRHLDRKRFDLYLTHFFPKKRYLLMKAGVQLSGDYDTDLLPTQDFMKYYATALYGWRKSENFSWGIGAYYGFQGGRHSAYPAVSINYWKNEHFGIECLLPAFVRLIYRHNDANYFTLGYGVSSTRYLIDTKTLGIPNQEFSVLARNDLQFYGDYQFRIYKFIWGSLTGGINYNHSLELEEEFPRDADILIDSDINLSPFFQASLFLTLPERIANRE